MPKILGNNDNFKEYLENGVTLVDFYADWCGPCKNLAPTLDELEAKFEGKISVLKVNVDENPELAKEYKVRGIPSLFFHKDGEVKSQLTGVQPLSELEDQVNQLLS